MAKGASNWRVKEVRGYWRGPTSARPETARAFLKERIYARDDVVWVWWMVVALGFASLGLQGALRTWLGKKAAVLDARSWFRGGACSLVVFGVVLSYGAVEAGAAAVRGASRFVDRLDDLVDFWRGLTHLTDDMLSSSLLSLLPDDDDDDEANDDDDDCGDDMLMVETTTRALAAEFDDARRPLARYVRLASRVEGWSLSVALYLTVPWFTFYASLVAVALLSLLEKRTTGADPRAAKDLCLRGTAAWTTALWLPPAILFLASLVALAVYVADFCSLGPADVLLEDDARNAATAWYLRKPGVTATNPLLGPVLNCSSAVSSALSSSCSSSSSSSSSVALLRRNIDAIENATIGPDAPYASLAEEAFYEQLCRHGLSGVYASYVVLAATGVAALVFLVSLPAVRRAIKDDAVRRRLNAVIADESFFLQQQRRDTSHAVGRWRLSPAPGSSSLSLLCGCTGSSCCVFFFRRLQGGEEDEERPSNTSSLRRFGDSDSENSADDVFADFAANSSSDDKRPRSWKEEMKESNNSTRPLERNSSSRASSFPRCADGDGDSEDGLPKVPPPLSSSSRRWLPGSGELPPLPPPSARDRERTDQGALRPLSGVVLLPILTSRNSGSRLSSRTSAGSTLASIAEETASEASSHDGTPAQTSNSSGDHGRRGFAKFFRSYSLQSNDDDGATCTSDLTDDDTNPAFPVHPVASTPRLSEGDHGAFAPSSSPRRGSGAPRRLDLHDTPETLLQHKEV
eukprot:CAMPEP_0118895248 /NCGR_PEP_ID=MMETSP1166-20130328/3683_1 /TAXON_ID=1104430 /ORGANISM="Chrysoreinhardia sp, Strain CCMP3193" /LENGTH=743 /DNA_ID=CAMNT_0006834251 /DNA_START=50 /DNA_END=2281 /DNA_ORIENTATION=+